MTLKVGESYFLDNKRYKILNELPSGTFKATYIAVDKHNDSKVVIAESRDSSRPLLEGKKFKRIIKYLKNDNGEIVCNPRIICPIAIIENGKYIITNYFEGIDLFDYIGKSISQKKKIPDEIIYKIMTNCVDALIDLHEKLHFAHLDIKPENIMFNQKTNDIGLIDLGEGCSLDPDSINDCEFGPSKGTNGYMSPEILFNIREVKRNEELMRSSDVYSLGCVFYELLYFRRPFDWVDESKMSIKEAIEYHLDKGKSFDYMYSINKPPREKLNKFFDSIVSKMLDAEAVTRITLRELKDELSEYPSLKTQVGGNVSDSEREASNKMWAELDPDPIFKIISEKDPVNLQNLLKTEPLQMYEFIGSKESRFTTVEWAIENNCLECIKVILSMYDTFKTDTVLRFNTDIRLLGQPVHLAVKKDDKDLVHFLVTNGFSINKLNRMGFAPLHIAVMERNLPMIKFLLRYSAEIDIYSKDEQSPLLIAIKNRDFDIAKTLIKSGADLFDDLSIELNDYIDPQTNEIKQNLEPRLYEFINSVIVNKYSKKKREAIKLKEYKDRKYRRELYKRMCENLTSAVSNPVIRRVADELRMDISNLTREEVCKKMLSNVLFKEIKTNY
jgi:serine/threonine protein kinase/phosphoribosylformylglycinamidine (FGAM) synthase PurS component